jgi:hypothetical protein
VPHVAKLCLVVALVVPLACDRFPGYDVVVVNTSPAPVVVVLTGDHNDRLAYSAAADGTRRVSTFILFGSDEGSGHITVYDPGCHQLADFEVKSGGYEVDIGPDGHPHLLTSTDRQPSITLPGSPTGCGAPSAADKLVVIRTRA